MRFIATLILSLLWTSAMAATTINAVVVRNEAGSGDMLVSSGFPLPAGLVTEQTIRDGTIRVLVDGTEVAANVSALRGRHRDGSVRSVLIQFRTTLEQNATVAAQVIAGGAARTYADPAYVRPTMEIVEANNVIVATDPTYLCSTLVSFQNLLPEGSATASEEKQYTTLAENRFDALVANPVWGTASYENARGMVAMWQRTGDYKYHRQSVLHALEWLPYNTPTDDSCPQSPYINPDGRTGINGSCGVPAEWHYARFQSYAALYLLTGYRDFWGLVAERAQRENAQLVDVAAAQGVAVVGTAYHPRFNYNKYAAMFPALAISATVQISNSGAYGDGRTLDFSDQQNFAITGLDYHKWDLAWIPFSGGSGSVPVAGSTISQGGVSATLLSVNNATDLPKESAMPSSGYIQVKKSSITGGSFSSGALTGITANATGAAIDDYRNGYLGMRSNSGEIAEPTPVFQSIFPANFLIDQYLYVYADSRIPHLVQSHVNAVLQTIAELHSPGTDATWGTQTHGHNYSLALPVITSGLSTYTMPEYARALAFLIKTVGDYTVAGKAYSQWYEICINTANNAPSMSTGGLIWQWKLWGQYYGMSQDAPWIMAQESLSGPSTFVEPTAYAATIWDTPDVYRTSTPDDPTPTASGPILRTGDSLLLVGGCVLRAR